MNNKLYILAITFLINLLGNSQNNFYYYNGKKVFLELDKSKVNITTSLNFDTNVISNIGLKDFILEQDDLTSYKFVKTEFISEQSVLDFYQKLNLIKNLPNVKNVGLYFKVNDSISIGTSNYFYVKLKNESDTEILIQYCIGKNVQIVKNVPYMPKWYILSTTNSEFTSVELTNQFYESGYCDNVDPAFIFNYNVSCANDPEFGSLWGLYNSNNPQYDINACQAWGITQGSGINIAVFDTGTELDHIDLSANMHQLSYDTKTQTSPSIIRGQGDFAHGTKTAGIIGAVKDNNLQVVGIAPSSKMMSISSNFFPEPTISAQLASGFGWAKENSDVINNSWGDPNIDGIYFGSALLENSIEDAIKYGRNGLGCVVLFATGNENGPIRYPAHRIPSIITVGSILPSGVRSTFSNYGNQLDVVAPGSGIITTTLHNSMTGSINGTSYACPYVSGIAGLVLSVNPCLTSKQVTNIIELTCQKISPNGLYTYNSVTGRKNGGWNNLMGYGLVDAYAAVEYAIMMGTSDVDLMVKDSPEDMGVEPNITTQYMWISDDIWVRNNNDNSLIHQNPDYSANGNPNYVIVRVLNKGCFISTGNEQLKLYWSKASTGLGWINPWLGGVVYPPTGASMGNPIGTLTIPEIEPGQEVILTFPWQVPNPADYEGDQDQWHFCLLARVESLTDPMTVNETTDLNLNVRNNNNNIAWKNITVVDVLPNNIANPGGTVAVVNPFNYPKSFNLEMVVLDMETGKPIFEEAEVSLKMDDVLYRAWQRGGNVAQLLDSTIDENRKIVKGNNVLLENILFSPNEIGSLRLDFNFLTKELTDKTNYVYHVIQKDTQTGDIIGGETFIINKNSRPFFEAEAENKEVDLNQEITISAEDINEPAIYNWYDTEGVLIYQGKVLQIANAAAEKYKLEVISTIDGFKDYTEVEVKIKPSSLKNILPNPAINNVIVSYKLNGVNSAYLMVIGYYGGNGISNNYILDVNSNEMNLNLVNYENGYYTVALVVNGEIVDAKTLLKQ